MKSFIRNLSARSEFCLVLPVGFGPFVAMQLWNVIQSKPLHITNGGLVAVTIVELMLLVAVLWIGKERGWSIATFGFGISLRGTGGGLILFVVAEAAMAGACMGIQAVHPEQSPFASTRFAVLPVFLSSFINPVFEEVLERGYFIQSLSSRAQT